VEIYGDIEFLYVSKMANGVTGMLGVHAVWPVAKELKIALGFVTIQHPLMEELIALEMQLIWKIVQMGIVLQKVNYLLLIHFTHKHFLKLTHTNLSKIKANMRTLPKALHF